MAISPWTFTPFPPFPPTFLPNTAFYNATSPSSNVTYQISLSYPFRWGPPSLPTTEITNKTALTLYVTDGNAYSLTATEHIRRRGVVDATQPDTVVVGIGYALSDNVYDLVQRNYDFNAPLPPYVPPLYFGADIFLDFIADGLRPWVQREVFPGVKFTRDALYGHSSGGMFVTHALISRPEMFDTFLAASPSLVLLNATILGNVTRRLGDGMGIPGEFEFGQNATKPAVMLSYGSIEAYPLRKRTENETQFQRRKALLQRSRLENLTHELYDRLVGSGKMRDVMLKEYAEQDHASVGGSALMDGFAYFADW